MGDEKVNDGPASEAAALKINDQNGTEIISHEKRDFGATAG